MWLTQNPRPAFGPSAHQFAAFRIALGLCVVLCLGVGVGAASPQSWLDLPRMLRAAMRLLAIAAGLGLVLGAFRRTSAGVTLLTLLGATAFGYLPHSVALELGSLTLLVALATFDAEPWSLTPRTLFGAPQHPHRHWSTAAWVAFGVSTLLTAASAPVVLAGAVMVAALLGLGWIAWRGPVPWVVALMLAANLLVSACSSAPVAHVLLLLCSSLALIDQHCLPAGGAGATPILFYDGVCGLCQGSVQLILREDRHARLALAPLQGETARQRLPEAFVRGSGAAQDAPDSMVVLSAGTLLRESDSALFIARQLGGAWRLFELAAWLPKGLRDTSYRWIARNRYSWFGKLEACPVPDASVRARFLP